MSTTLTAAHLAADGKLRRPSVLGVHSLHEFVISVPNLEQAEEFYRAFGLDVRRAEDHIALYTYGHSHRWARIYQGESKKLLWLSWGIYAEDEQKFSHHLEAQGVREIEAPRLADPSGFWFAGPDGVPQQLIISDKCTPDKKSTRSFSPEQSEQGRAPRRSAIKQVQPRRLSHVLTFTADVDSSARFYMEMLGLRLSDRSGSVIVFMHGPHGSDHHLLALAASDGAGLHHASWDVESFDDVGLGSQQMAQAGYSRGWGLGRHVLGSNYFRYVRDPWGSYCEYSFDIDHIAANYDWPAADYPPEDALYVWGDIPPSDFTKNYETAERESTSVSA
ncbi:metapyrocatechase [Herbaspirillum huttiense]|uniref:VOC family protein n=1 Tax=Herbaspirillum huttiense TaxID=863372 RepID=UPI0010657726|nr:VOC family protein [Herbaspirillum huttiense]QBP77682.1 metapyrocatechase [Herbaspirillum huttiense]